MKEQVRARASSHEKHCVALFRGEVPKESEIVAYTTNPQIVENTTRAINERRLEQLKSRRIGGV